ncbi:MAG: hypothetical protein AB8C95_04830, partial [Phycisphaeraceae bacterium]
IRMLTLLNLGIILILLIMVAIWATYGFFSAFIHLMIVIGSGVLAFALWEPVTYMLLGTKFVQHAHGLGLLIPFVVLLIILRVVFDKFCRSNVHMPRIADQIGGAACGFCSGVLAFGLLLNAVNYLPMHREVMGWEPYKVAGNEVNDNAEGKLWGFLRINEWSASFFNSVSTGSMSPIGGTPLAQGRPDLAKRAVLTRLPADENQLRTAHPETVKLAGVYAMPATEEAIAGLAQRSAILTFLNPAYTLPDDLDYGETGQGLVDFILKEFDLRYQDPDANGKPIDLINIESILAVARTPQYEFKAATSQEGFPEFVKMVANKMGKDMVQRLKPVIGENKILYIVDTAWNDKFRGTFNSDGKLRVAIPQVGLALDDEIVAPIGYSIQYSQNNGGRVFTEIISPDSNISTRDAAYSTFTELNIGWIFALKKGDQPDHFFVRELRFNLSDLKKPEGQETKENQNPGAVAHVIGAPLLPSSADGEDEGNATTVLLTGGTKLEGTNTYADISEKLPGSFAAAASSLDLDKSADPWVLNSGRADKVISGRGGKKSSVSEIGVQPSVRLVRLKLDAQKAKSLYGRAIQLTENLSVMRVKDEGGNFYSAIGYALLRADGTMEIDIREDAFNRGLSAGELPDLGAGETLMVYFQVPIGTKVTSYVVGATEQKFEEILLVGGREQR